MTIIGITGTRSGATPQQLFQIETFLRQQDVTRLNHGDCVGVDEQSHWIAVRLGRHVTVHPPTDPKYRTFCSTPPHQVVVMPEKPYHDRNKDIVIDCDKLLVVPRTETEVMRGSGTWSTKRYAAGITREFYIIYPDGYVDLGWDR